MCSDSLVSTLQPAPSDDPADLLAMLAAERVENERLRKIIRELQRHRFGRRAESLPVDQLLLGRSWLEAPSGNT